MAVPRKYRSPLREAHSEETHERIVLAALEYLETNEADTLTLPQVGKLAGVSVPTVYAHFPTLDALYLSVFRWIQPRLGLQPDQYPASIDMLGALPARHFPAYAKYSRALCALLLAPGFHRARASDRPDRHGAWLDAVSADVPELDSKERRLAAFAVNAFWTPTLWNWLVGSCGLTTDEAIRTASWAIRRLTEALKQDPAGLKEGAAVSKEGAGTEAKHTVGKLTTTKGGRNRK